MSTLFVDTINEKTSGNGIYIPGHVVQVINTVKTDVFSTTSTSFVDVTGLSATITPSSTSSKILVLVNGFISNDAANNYCFVKILRGTTEIDENVQVEANAFANSGKNFLNVIYDSPSTTSATTYKVQIRAELSSNPSRINGGAGAGTTNYTPNTNITLMEIGG